MRNLSYLACPYTEGITEQTSPLMKWQIQQDRHLKANIAAGLLFEQGYRVYSPISHGPVLEPYMSTSSAGDWVKWMDHCYAMLEHCEEVFVLRIKGWWCSKGVKAEIKYAKEHNLPVYFVDLIVEDIVEGVIKYSICISDENDYFLKT